MYDKTKPFKKFLLCPLIRGTVLNADIVDDLHFSWPIAMLWSSFLLKSLWSIYITLKRDKIFFSINILILLSICPYCL